MASAHTLGARERLKSRKQLDQLFQEGKSWNNGPLKLFYRFRDSATGNPVLQAGFGVSKRNFKKAVDRNRIKRLLREAYRLQKADLQEALLQRKQAVDLFLLFTGRELPEQQFLKEKILQALNRLQKITDENRITHP